MKVGDLITLMASRDPGGRHLEDEVVVLLSQPSIGPCASSPVRAGYYGFDWDSGKLLLQTGDPLVIKSENQALWQSVRDFLFMMSGETRHYKGEERLTTLAKEVRKIFSKHGIKPRKVGTFVPED